jgi:hypothetical protein
MLRIAGIYTYQSSTLSSFWMPEQSLNLDGKKIRNLPIPKESFIKLGGWQGDAIWQGTFILKSDLESTTSYGHF